MMFFIGLVVGFVLGLVAYLMLGAAVMAYNLEK